MSAFTQSPPLRADAVGKKRSEPDRPAPDGSRPINFRAPAPLARDLDFVADALGLDVSNLVRMILRENMQPYRERAEKVRRERDEG
jgi:hypothetical protein